MASKKKDGYMLKSEVLLIIQNYIRTIQMNDYNTDSGIPQLYKAMNYIDNAPTADVVEIPKSGIGDLSDGYHTFNELYHHRAVLFSAICNSMSDKAWKSKLHDTGDMYEGMFIVGIETPNGQVTYHYDIEPYWDMFKVKELEKAPKWDGHTSTDAIKRIADILYHNVPNKAKTALRLRMAKKKKY